MTILVLKYPSEGMVDAGVSPGALFELTDLIQDEDACQIERCAHCQGTRDAQSHVLLEVRLVGSPNDQWQAQPWRFAVKGSSSTIVTSNEVTFH